MNVSIGRKSEVTKTLEFHKHFGSSSLDIAKIWFDIYNSDSDNPKIILPRKRNRIKYSIVSLRPHFGFGLIQKSIIGKEFWKWVIRIEALKTKKIVWDDPLDNPNLEVFAILADGVDFLM